MTWEAPEKMNGELETYTVQWEPSGGEMTTKDLNITLTELDACEQLYTVAVTATSRGGTSPKSQPAERGEEHFFLNASIITVYLCYPCLT